MKKLATYVFSAISIFSLLYFTVKYYFDGALNFNHSNILMWTIFIFIILFTLVLGICNNRELQLIKKQNTDLSNLVLKLVNSHDDKCDELLTTLLNSSSCVLVMYTNSQKYIKLVSGGKR